MKNEKQGGSNPSSTAKQPQEIYKNHRLKTGQKSPQTLGITKKMIPDLFGSGIMVGEGGFEPPKSVTTDLQSAPFGRSGIPPY